MVLLAHTDGDHGWASLFAPWEIHPALNHLPIAFLLGGVALDLVAARRGRLDLAQTATGLLLAGLLTGLAAAAAGALAFFTVPAHTAEAHALMYWHLGVQAAALVLFAGPTWVRWRNRPAPPAASGRLVVCVAAALLVIGSGLGGYIVYHGGTGVDPELLTPEVRHGHAHLD